MFPFIISFLYTFLPYFSRSEIYTRGSGNKKYIITHFPLSPLHGPISIFSFLLFFVGVRGGNRALSHTRSKIGHWRCRETDTAQPISYPVASRYHYFLFAPFFVSKRLQCCYSFLHRISRDLECLLFFKKKSTGDAFLVGRCTTKRINISALKIAFWRE